MGSRQIGDAIINLTRHSCGVVADGQQLENGILRVSRAAVLRTARKLFEGRVFPRDAG